MSKHTPIDSAAGAASSGAPSATPFTPVAVRHRHDGWTPTRQHAFIAALAESGCVVEACGAVGIAPKSAYRLRARPDASTFRQAWDVALDYAIRKLGDLALSRALHGVANPIFYQGQQIGERRHYDEKLTMFLLRYRDPVRYGAWNDGYEARRHPDGAGIMLAHALNSVLDAAHGQGPVFDPNQVDAAGDPIVEPLLPRAIAAGPAPSAQVPAEDYDGPEELRELFERVRAAGIADRHAEVDNDPVTDDWNSALPIRRSRRRSDFDGS